MFVCKLFVLKREILCFFQEADLGTISLGVLYLSFTVFSIVASLVVKKIGSKNALLLGTTGYWLFIAANLKPSW